MKFCNINAGMSKTMQKEITEEDTALYYGSGSIQDLLATPVLSALMIEAAVSVVDPLLPDGYMTIGKYLSIEHLEPTVKGMTVTVNASIIEIENNKITFAIKAYDELGQIGSGIHERYIVNYSLLKQKVSQRTERLTPQPK
ncbi:thioesterase family protein [Lutispora thermophila]|uniref:Predicted thioesterase n=1 Tax=Lutispora thermophila DSM 19022 TaxID=1122184 RepID=A0A1M6CH15_9FIRM|nr:hypothetical protein [Lutispora thermophila]SHI60302.1 Predicted thioesterase [Lutispora thermophila DSM 19022]